MNERDVKLVETNIIVKHGESCLVAFIYGKEADRVFELFGDNRIVLPLSNHATLKDMKQWWQRVKANWPNTRCIYFSGSKDIVIS